MDKSELIRAMQPFVEEVPIVVRGVDGRYYEVVRSGYAQTADGDGLLVLIAGQQTFVRPIA